MSPLDDEDFKRMGCHFDKVSFKRLEIVNYGSLLL